MGKFYEKSRSGWPKFLQKLPCLFGFHRRTGPMGQPANYCPCCGYEINPHAYSAWLITLKDGSEFTVDAVSAVHAVNLIESGKSVHVSNMKTICQLSPLGTPLDVLRIRIKDEPR